MALTPKTCHGAGASGPACSTSPRRLRVALVGSPNVGKSALFNRLTHRYVTVSNYPGTSVEITRGTGSLDGLPVEILDTPGLYSLSSDTEEQRAVRRFLLEGGADVLVHVVDAKLVSRMLALTLQLMELGRPLVVALNMMDEASRHGVRVDAAALSARLGLPVVPLVAVTGAGLADLARAIAEASRRPVPPPPPFGNGVGEAVRALRDRLRGSYPVDPTAVAALLLQGDAEAAALVKSAEPDGGRRALAAAAELGARLEAPPAYRLAVERRLAAAALAGPLVRREESPTAAWGTRLGRLLTRPATGIPVMLLVLYVGLYQFVGRFGGGTLVDWIEGSVFEQRLNPWMAEWFARLPWEAVRALFVGEYGLLTLGLRYAVAIILPVVGTFFVFFSVLEDSGYFPRLALLMDRGFKRMGLSGRAVIPMVLGFACDTMATLVTRTLATKRERVLATFLLALAIPCSAQLGVILALLAHRPQALGVWVAALLGIFLAVGWLAARLLPGEGPLFHLELPPMRWPRLGNVLTKTVMRMQWYFLEVLPLFLLASVLLWAGDLTGVFGWISGALTPVVGALGLPAETGRIFLFGFFRRDYGAAGLFDLERRGLLSVAQLTVAAVTLTLFVPCIAQFLTMIKERGLKTALAMLGIITPLAFGAGWALHWLLRGWG